jgi:glycosyltransferase involved in cell wall biosynthesis
VRIGVHFGEFQPEIGGGYTYVADLLGALAESVNSSKHDYYLMCDPAAVNSMKARVGARNVTVVPVATPSQSARWILGLKYFSPVFRRLWRRLPGSVERAARSHGVHLLWYLGADLYESMDVPYIATVLDLQHRHQPYFPEVSARGIWDTREQIYSHFLRRATYCLTGTQTGKREIQYLYQLAETRVRVVPLPTPKFALDPPASNLDARARFGIEKGYIFYPAQFWPHKNHANLILALKWLVEQKQLDILLVLSGSNRGNLPFVRDFAREQGMEDRVRFLGFVSEEELVALYRGALALTYVTYFGPDNLPPLEAFALGCPVIASAVDGAAEQYGDAVVQVDPSHPEDIGRAVWDLSKDQNARENLIRAGSIRAKAWTAAHYVRAMFDLFDEFSAVRRNWA